MILLVKRLVTSLERYQHVAVIVPTFFPIGMAQLFSFLELAWWCQALIYILWGVVALTCVAFMLQRDRVKAEQHVSQRVGEVAIEVDHLASEFSRATASQQRQTEALSQRVDRMEQAMREELDVHLPHILNLAGSVDLSIMTGTARVHVKGPHRGRLVRMRQWIQQQGRQFIRWVCLMVWGSHEDSLGGGKRN